MTAAAGKGRPAEWCCSQLCVYVCCAVLSVLLQPHEVTAKKMGVGACAWEGEMLLAAYLLSEWGCC